MKHWAIQSLKLLSGAYFLTASVYCFLAFIPFTYLFVIVNPPFKWVITFAHYHLMLLWPAAAAAIISNRSVRYFRALAALETLFALLVSICNPILHIRNDWQAFAWGVGFLLPVAISSAMGFAEYVAAATKQGCSRSVEFYSAGSAGFLCAFVSIGAPRLADAIRGGFVVVQRYDAELLSWAIFEHVVLAVAIACFINLVRHWAQRLTRNSVVLGAGTVGFVVFIGLSAGWLFFIEDSLSLRGGPAWVYAILFSAAITLTGLDVLSPLLCAKPESKVERWVLAILATSLLALVVDGWLTVDLADDWNAIFHESLTVLLWMVVTVGVFTLRPSQKHYPMRTVLAAALATFCVYEGLSYSKPVWAADVGLSDAQIQHEMKNYSNQNVSFGMVEKLLGNNNAEPCDAACKTLRQYSNIRKATIPREFQLVDNLSRTPGPKPNIFIFVIDSVRPDYLGVYNPRVDFTPNIDAFARTSVVMRRAYTNYAGTSLSEPAIWAGTLLLHAHYAQPFQKVDSLDKLARADGYQLVLSYDEILQQLIAPSKDIIQLDTETRMWSQVELSSTLAKLEAILDQRNPGAAPVFFYTQPMNVQVHAWNHLPKRTKQNWQTRPGFDDRIAYALHQVDGFLGTFFDYLKSKGMFDDSIIILTADHGDATGELGRVSHSTIIYPEVMKVPLIIHLPETMRKHYVYDENELSALIDIAPSLYYLLGHRPIKPGRLSGRPMFLETPGEIDAYPRHELFLASDAIAAYGILSEDGQWMYATYDSPARTMLFDLARDPEAQHNVVTPELKKQYDARLLRYLQWIADFYGYHPTGGV